MRVFKAKWILPISQPPIHGGWIATDRGRIVAFGHANDSLPVSLACTTHSSKGPVVTDLGDVAILPALVNAHTHLQLSDLTEPIGHPGIKLHDWISEVIRYRFTGRPRCQEEMLTIVHAGMQQAVMGGAGLIGEIATSPWTELVEMGKPTGVSVDLVAFAEMLGLTEERADSTTDAAFKLQARLRGHHSISFGLSPHAPYSTMRSRIESYVRLAANEQLPVAMHIAESDEERALIEKGDGPFLSALENALGEGKTVLREQFPWGRDATVDLLKLLSNSPMPLIVHGNYLNEVEIDYLSGQPHMTVVYCPRTHAYFRHPLHPVEKMIQSGIRVALGTDSLASNPDLSLWGEVQWLLAHRQDLTWQTVLELATINGADALRRRDLGRIETGSQCRLLAIASDAETVDDLPSSLITNSPRWLVASPS